MGERTYGVSKEEWDDAYAVASGIVSNLGIAVLMEDLRVINNIMRDITHLVEGNSEDALLLMKVVLMMCAKNSVDLYSHLNPEWRSKIENDIANRNMKKEND